MAISSEPKAREPKWYLKAHQMLFITLEDGASEFAVKYHWAVVAAMVNYKMAMMKATIQKKPNMKIQNM